MLVVTGGLQEVKEAEGGMTSPPPPADGVELISC